MATTIKLRNDTAENWTTKDPILAAGEAGVEVDTGKIKYGDGVTEWTLLGYGKAEAEITEIDGGNAAGNATVTEE